MKRTLVLLVLLCVNVNLALAADEISHGSITNKEYFKPAYSPAIDITGYSEIRAAIAPNDPPLNPNFKYTCIVMGLDSDDHEYPLAQILITTDVRAGGTVLIRDSLPNRIKIMVKINNPKRQEIEPIADPIVTPFAVWGRKT